MALTCSTSESESDSDGPTSTTNDDLVLGSILQDLRKKHSLILRKEGSLGKKRRKVAAQIDLLEKLALMPHNADAPADEEAGEEFTAELRQSPSENETKGPRYLCILNGCVICCLDLKLQGKEEPLTNARHVPPFPKIATLRLLEEGLSVSGGLLKLGSHTYLIGGQKFPAAAIENPGTHCSIRLGMNRYGSMNRIPKGFFHSGFWVFGTR